MLEKLALPGPIPRCAAERVCPGADCLGKWPKPYKLFSLLTIGQFMILKHGTKLMSRCGTATKNDKVAVGLLGTWRAVSEAFKSPVEPQSQRCGLPDSEGAAHASLG